MAATRRLALAIVAALTFVIACSPPAPANPSPSPSPSAAAPSPAGPSPVASASASPSPAMVTKGQAVTVSCAGAPCLSVVVVKWAFVAIYKGARPAFDDHPAKGHVFLGVDVRYTATTEGAPYSSTDWGVAVAGKPFQQAFPINGPKPELTNGNLADGKTVEGWIVFDVPAQGAVVLSHMVGQTPDFRVVLRGGA